MVVRGCGLARRWGDPSLVEGTSEVLVYGGFQERSGLWFFLSRSLYTGASEVLVYGDFQEGSGLCGGCVGRGLDSWAL